MPEFGGTITAPAPPLEEGADTDAAAAATLTGGGNGAIPTALLSLTAAAAAADAKVSPGARVGKGAGFMVVVGVLFETLAKGVCRVARAGSGDLNWLEGLLADAPWGSDMEVDFGLPLLEVGPRPSAESGRSSCID